MARMELDNLMQAAVGHHRAGRFDQAAALYRKVLDAVPEQPDALHLLGLALGRLGDQAQALALVERAVALQPDNPGFRFSQGNLLIAARLWGEAAEALKVVVAATPGDLAAKSTLAVALLELGEAAESERLLRAVLAADPGFVPALDNLAALLLKRNAALEAEQCARAALARAPEDPIALNNLGSALFQQDKAGEAEPHLRQAIKLRPEYAEAHFNLALVCIAQHWPEAADVALRAAIKLDRDNPRYLVTLSGVVRELSLVDESLALAQRAYALEPDTPDTLMALANAFRDQNDYERSEQLLRQAAELGDTAALWAMLSHMLWEKGDLAAARTAAERALVLNPNHAAARAALSNCGRCASLAEPNVVAMLALVEQPGLKDEERMMLRFALGKSFDDCGEHAQAFVHYRQANELKKALLPPYDHQQDRAYDAEVGALFTPQSIAAASRHGSSSELPVFVVGLPRSGTTLAEQIIASHPDAHGAGELLKMREINARIGALSADRGGPEYPEALFALRPEEIAQQAERYILHLRHHGGPDKLRVVDKMPLNLKHLGTIAVLFPNAHIVHCTRNPIDNCLSIYFQNFGRGNFFANDLKDLAKIYASCERLVETWKQRLPKPILDLPYEGVVEDPELWTRRLIEFIGLPWDERCLRFHETDRAVRTASAWQVKQPIYKRSVARWKRYGDAIQPLIDALRAEGVEVDA